MESNSSTERIRQIAWNVSLILIAFFYISYFAFDIFFSLFFRCFLGCTPLSTVQLWDVYLTGGVLVLALIEAVGLFKRLWWARIFGIVLATLLLLPSFVKNFWYEYSFINSVTDFVNNPFNTIAALIFIYLTIPYFNKNWIRSGSRSTLIALALSILTTILFGVSLYNYYRVILPEHRAQAAEEQAAVKQIVKAGEIYKNPEHGFELTFPVDKTVLKREHVNDIEFSTTAYSPTRYTDTFFVGVGGIYVEEKSTDGITAAYLKREPRNRVYPVIINGITFVKVEHYPNGNSFEYVIIHNGKVLSFTNYGGLKESDFDTIMQTIKFDNQ